VMKYLTDDQIEFYRKHGYLVIERFWDADTVQTLKKRIHEIVADADLTNVKSVFSTREHMRKADDYFLNSGREIRFFWEEKARDENGQLVSSKDKCINKVGHALHDLDPTFEAVSYEGRIGSICEELGLEKPLAVQSMYIFKQARIGGLVVPHQDGAFLYTEPQSCIGLWWPLDDCNQENGCLWAVPGSHTLGVHRRFRRRDPPDEGTEFVPFEPVAWDTSDAVPLLIPQGSLVVLHNALVHFSNENNSDVPRHAYSIHVVDGKEGISYPADNWLQRPEGYPFREITNRYEGEPANSAL
jgi:phytanoyl-CoA hydroxylase